MVHEGVCFECYDFLSNIFYLKIAMSLELGDVKRTHLVILRLETKNTFNNIEVRNKGSGLNVSHEFSIRFRKISVSVYY